MIRPPYHIFKVSRKVLSKRLKVLSGSATHDGTYKRVREPRNGLKSNVLTDHQNIHRKKIQNERRSVVGQIRECCGEAAVGG